MSTYTYSLDGESGVSLSDLEKALRGLGIQEDDDITAYLPRPAPTKRNTTERLRTTLHKRFGRGRSGTERRRIQLHEASFCRDGSWSAEVHVSGAIEGVSTLSEELYHIKATFSGGKHNTLEVRAINGDEAGETAIREAFMEAECSLSSKSWSDSWNSLHAHIGSIKTTSMNFLCYREEQVTLVDQYVRIAQACGIRRYRHDQPQFAVAEQLGMLIRKELEEQENRLQGDGRVTAKLATSRLERVAEFSKTLLELRELLGGLGAKLEESVDKLKTTWEQVRDEAQRPVRQAREMIALTEAGRAWMMECGGDRCYTLVGTDLAREKSEELQAIRDLQPANTQTVIDLTVKLASRPVRFDRSQSETITALMSQGFVEPQVLNEEETRALYNALQSLHEAPQLVDHVNIDAIPTFYLTTITHRYQEA